MWFRLSDGQFIDHLLSWRPTIQFFLLPILHVNFYNQIPHRNITIGNVGGTFYGGLTTIGPNNCQFNFNVSVPSQLALTTQGHMIAASSTSWNLTVQKASITIGGTSHKKSIQLLGGLGLAVDIPVGGRTGFMAINTTSIKSNEVFLFQTSDSLAWDVSDINQYLFMAIVSQFKATGISVPSWDINEVISYGSKPLLTLPGPSYLPTSTPSPSVGKSPSFLPSATPPPSVGKSPSFRPSSR
jgi:hypothetical protein